MATKAAAGVRPAAKSPARKAPATVAGQEQLALENTPRLVNGLTVVRDDPLISPLSQPGRAPITFAGQRVLTLADGSTVHGCADCAVTGSRGDINKHRRAEHPKDGDEPPKQDLPEQRQDPDPVVQGVEVVQVKRRGRPPGSASKFASVPASALSISLGELLHVATAVDQWDTVNQKLTADVEQWKTRALDAENEVRRYQRAFTKLGWQPKLDDTHDDDDDVKVEG